MEEDERQRDDIFIENNKKKEKEKMNLRMIIKEILKNISWKSIHFQPAMQIKHAVKNNY